MKAYQNWNSNKIEATINNIIIKLIILLLYNDQEKISYNECKNKIK